MQLAFDVSAPVYLRMGKSDRGDVHQQAITFKAGQLLPSSAQPKKIALIATGLMVFTAQALVQQGLDAETRVHRPSSRWIQQRWRASVGASIASSRLKSIRCSMVWGQPRPSWWPKPGRYRFTASASTTSFIAVRYLRLPA